MDTGIRKVIDDLGRIVIPKEVRRELGIKEGDKLDIQIDENKRIVLSKHVNSCDVYFNNAYSKFVKLIDEYESNYDIDMTKFRESLEEIMEILEGVVNWYTNETYK